MKGFLNLADIWYGLVFPGRKTRIKAANFRKLFIMASGFLV